MRKDRDKKDPRNGQSGQATVLIALMISTFFLFFAFVINTGMLVNAKINLQNAADLAAYSGASVQARQLDQIAHLNYEMRRIYKRFLFRYYVLGNLAQDKFPRTGGDATPHKFGPIKIGASAAEEAANDFKVPSVCIIYNSNSNLCRNREAASTMKPSYSNQVAVNLFNRTLYEQMKRLEALRVQNCVAWGKMNFNILNNWLFNSDPEVQNMTAGTSAENQRTVEVIRQVIYGMGLVPKEMMLRQRIRTLESYVNAPAQNMTRELKNTLSADPQTAAENERGIQAWMSAYLTLGDYAYGDVDAIELQELLPQQGDRANLAVLKDVKINFDAYATQFSKKSCPPEPDEWTKVPATTSTAENDSCMYCPTPFKMTGITIGVSKDPTVLTYYAISLKARARVLFSPFGDMTLKAYAAARPFGSRIGPELAATDVTKQAAYEGFCGLDEGACFRQIPNLPLAAGETTATGWYRKDVLWGFYWALNPNPSSGGFIANAITPDMVQSAMHAASTPNPWEKGKYNIPHDLVDPNADQFERFFSPQDGNYAIWAPLVKNSGDEGALNAFVDEMVTNYTTSSPNLQTNPAEFEAFKQAVKTDFRAYLAKLRNSQGEGGETMNIYRIKNPFRTLSSSGQATGGFLQLPATLAINGGAPVSDIRTSWDDVKDANFKAQGRTGYSVKFVTLKSLRDGGTSTNGSETFNNYLAPLGDSASDLQFLQH